MSDRRGVLMVMYDLPNDTSALRRDYAAFRKSLIRSGFVALQKSVYVKLLRNVSSAESEIKQIRIAAPSQGVIQTFPMSLNEFRGIRTVIGEAFNMALFADDIVWLEPDEK